MIACRSSGSLRAWTRPPRVGPAAAWGFAALIAGIVIAALQPLYAAALLGGATLLIAAIVEPLVGLALMIAAGLAEPLLAAAGLLPFPYSQAIFLLFVGAWLLRGVLKHEIRWPRLPLTVFFFIYLSACALSVYTSQPVSPKDAATELWKWLQMYLIAGVVYETARYRIRLLLTFLLCIGLTEAGIGIWQFQFRGHGPAGFKILGNHWRAYGTLEQPNPFGGLMGLVWPVALAVAAWAALSLLQTWRARRRGPQPAGVYAVEESSRPRWSTWALGGLGLLTAAVTLAALYLSFSRGAWLGAAAAGAAMVVALPRRRWLGLALAGGAAGVILGGYSLGLLPAAIASRFSDVGDFVQVYDVRGIHINDTNFAIVERLAHWQAAVNMADAHPLFGVGVGNYEPAYDSYRLAAWRYGLGHAHNIYLNVLAETGAIGLIGYLFFWGGILWLTFRILSRSGPGNAHLNRLLAAGLLGCWTHLAVHQILDNLYVGNIPLYLGALFGLLAVLDGLTSYQTRSAGRRLQPSAA